MCDMDERDLTSLESSFESIDFCRDEQAPMVSVAESSTALRKIYALAGPVNNEDCIFLFSALYCGTPTLHVLTIQHSHSSDTFTFDSILHSVSSD